MAGDFPDMTPEESEEAMKHIIRLYDGLALVGAFGLILIGVVGIYICVQLSWRLAHRSEVHEAVVEAPNWP